MLLTILIMSACVIALAAYSITLYVDRHRWKHEYQRDIERNSARYSGEMRKLEENLSSEHLENIQLKERIEKLETVVSGYRNIMTEAHDTLSTSIKKDYKALIQSLRELRIRLMIFAKQDNTLPDVPVGEMRKSDFIHRLMSEYPEITESSAQLAYLIAINTPVKTICQVLGINAKSVQMARFRLRKKMKLEQSDSLEDTLQAMFEN